MKKGITYVGLDVHATSIALAVLPPGAERSLTSEIPNEAKTIRRTFTRLQAEHGEVRACYEAGACGFELYRQLTGLDVSCDVVAPALIPQRPGERIKTDRRDATKLVRLYRAGELTAIHVPTPEQEAARDLVRAREDVRRDLTAARHRLGKFLLRHGQRYLAGRNWTRGFWAWLNRQHFDDPAAQAAFDHYALQVHHLEERRDALEAQIARLAETAPYQAPVQRLTCLRGISTLSAMVLLTELHDLRRFTHPRQLMSFVGLVPSEHSSGSRQQRGRITKTGNSHARRILVEAALAYRHRLTYGPRVRRALPGQPPEIVAQVAKAHRRLHQRFAHLISRGKRTQLATIAVARELCGFVWALMVRPAAA
jgi:transposase